MAVAGHDTMTRFDHAARVLRLAKEMTEIAADEMARVSHGMRIRVGIHTGKLVGVVLGGRCPRYSLHGEMLDELCLIERCGSPMRVQISEATYNAIQETEAGSDMDLVKGFRYLGEQTDPGTGLRTKVWFAELGDWKTASEPNRLPVERESLPVSKDNQTKLPYRDVAIVPEVISEEDSQSEDPDGSLEQQGLLPEDR